MAHSFIHFYSLRVWKVLFPEWNNKMVEILLALLILYFPFPSSFVNREHDTNDDNHLDGLELLNSIFHVFAVEAHAVGGHLSVQSTIERIASEYNTIHCGAVITR